MFNTCKRVVVIVCMLCLAFGLQGKAYASETLVYSNDFNTEEDKVKYADEKHQNALYNSDSIINLNNYIYDKLTITMWLKPMKPMGEDIYLLSLEEDPTRSKGIYIGIDNSDDPRWSFGSGSDEIQTEQLVVLEEWVFAALIYDADNHQFRAVLNDTVYRKKYNKEISVNKLYLNAAGSMIDDLQVHSGILTLEQLEDIKGGPITEGRAKYPVYDKRKYINSDFSKTVELQEQLSVSKGQLQYEVTSSFLPVEKKIDTEGEYIDNLKKGDVVTVKEVILPMNKVHVETVNGKTGYLASSDFKSKLIKADESKVQKFMFTYINIANDSNSMQMILIFLAGSMAAVLVFILLQRLATKHSYIAIHGLFTPAIYVIMILLLAKLIGDEYETAWWLNEGWMSFPYGYTEFVHWFLFITAVLFILVHLVQNAIIIRNCGVFKGIITGISIVISNILAFFMIQMVITLLLSYFDMIGLIVVILFVVACLYYLKVNKFFIKVDEFEVPEYTAEEQQEYSRSRFYSEYQNNEEENTDKKGGYYKNYNDYKGYNNYSNSSYDSADQSTNQDSYNQSGNQSSNQYSDNHYYSNNGNHHNGARTNSERQKKSQYFAGVTKLEELQTRYRNLMKIYHPDIQCGNTEVSKQISEEYEYLKKILTE